MINEILEAGKDLANDTVVDFAVGSIIGLISWFFGGLDGLLKFCLRSLS